MSDPVLKIHARLCEDPRLVSGAKLLGVPKIQFFGAVLHLLCKAVDHAEDGDLWRGDGEASARFAAALADWPGDAGEFVHALSREGWLKEWMIDDWLGYAGDHLYRKHKSRNRNRLVEIHAKNGRVYGMGRAGNIPDASRIHPGNIPGDESGLEKNLPITPNPIARIPYTLGETKKKKNPTTPNPSAPEKKRNEKPKDGGVGEEERPERNAKSEDAGKNGASFISFREGLWDRGIALTLEQLDGSGLTHLEVYEAFKPVFVFHSLATLEAFYFRCDKCGCTPAWWTMVYLDKVHAVYRERPDGKAWLEDGADPVAMTMAAILPAYGNDHNPTGAARQLFLEIMIDHQRNRNGKTSRWAGRVTGNFIAKELELRKGKAGKIA